MTIVGVYLFLFLDHYQQINNEKFSMNHSCQPNCFPFLPPHLRIQGHGFYKLYFGRYFKIFQAKYLFLTPSSEQPILLTPLNIFHENGKGIHVLTQFSPKPRTLSASSFSKITLDSCKWSCFI